MASKIIRTGGASPYLDQLKRVRRLLARLEEAVKDPDEYRDRVYSFFQACWCLKDWTKNDPSINRTVWMPISTAVHAVGSPLRLCRDLANGSKHLRLDKPTSGSGASEHHLNYTVYPGQNRESDVECLVDDGHGNQIPAKDLARQCLARWESVLGNAGLKLG